jgi:hypothetical protein
MDSSNLPKPWLYKDKWMIWPESVLDNIKIVDCDDTIYGICLGGKTLEECIEQCVEECAAGYHIQLQDGTSICVPIRTAIHPYLNPVYRLRKQSIYPELDHLKVSTFVNTDVFPFPPESANVVFFRDIITMKDTVKGNTIGTRDAEIKGGGLIYMEQEIDNNITLLPTQISAEQVSQYMPVRYGDPIQLSVPSTSLMAGVNTNSNSLEWEQTAGFFQGTATAFRVMPIDSSKLLGDIVTFDDTFAILYENNAVVVLHPEYNYLRLDNNNLQDVLKNTENISTFQFISKMKGYYCEGNECKPVSIKDMQTFGSAGRYKGVTVGKNPDCWGLCNYLIPGTNSIQPLSTTPPDTRHKNIYLWILGMIIVIILSIIFIRLFITKKVR